jgi:lipopolysaccharide export system permease protein
VLKRLDIYIIRRFLTTFFFSLALILAIFIVFDIKDKLSTFTTQDIPLKEIVFDYYLMFIPYYGNLFSPMFVFISVIFFTSKMAQKTEFIAILCSGTSFNRVLRPYLLTAGFLALTSLVFNHFILPRAFKIKIGFEDKWINKDYNNDDHNIHRKIGPNRLLYIESYDNQINTGFKVSLEDVVDHRQTWFMSADNMRWDSTGREWIFTNVRERKIIAQDRLDTLKNEKPIYKQVTTTAPTKRMKLEFYPVDMWRDESKIETKSFFELRDYIAREKQKGSNRLELYEVESHKRSSFPFATFILTVIGVCVSSRKVRGGVGLQIALGLFLSCIYIMLMYIFTTIATTGNAPPFLAVWTPNFIFSFVALFYYRQAQK